MFAVASPHEHVIHGFSGRPDCGNPAAPLIADANGNLYGTGFGGANNLGCIFNVARTGTGWDETVLYSFSGPDGGGPSASLVFDSAGQSLWNGEGRGYSGGVAFELSPSGSGEWTETVLHSFGNGNDGTGRISELVFDHQGNLYGTTSTGGSHRCGIVFELSPSSGGWTETVLHEFIYPLSGPAAAVPVGGVVLDSNGNLYGNTGYGGVYGAGAVYELVPTQDGYKERVIHSFNIYDGLNPSSTPVMGSNGNLYGTTSFGGDLVDCPYVGCGTVFELTRGPGGSWTESVLHALNGQGAYLAVGPVALDSAGNVYAAAESGGVSYGEGSIFMLTPIAGGPWKETVLHRFSYELPNGTDGQGPYAGVILSHGHVFGTTSQGGGPAERRRRVRNCALRSILSEGPVPRNHLW